MAASASRVSFQSRWRRAGTIAIALAGVLALGSVWSSILRDTAIHTVSIFSVELPDGVAAQTPILVCAVYWLVFLVALVVALYMAVLDIRYIRLQYALEQRQLYQSSLGDEITGALRKRDREP